MASRPPLEPSWFENRPFCAYLVRRRTWRADLKAWRAARGARALASALSAGLGALLESYP